VWLTACAADEGECPPLAESLQVTNDATWAVYGAYTVQTDQGPVVQHFPIGTAWAVDRRLLVTNAHVAQAYQEYADAGVQLSGAIAIQAGTGRVVELLRKIVHPGYTGDPLRSPDVALLTTRDEMPILLPLAPEDIPLVLGDDLQIVGFPGDVTDAITIVPGMTVPQATSLTGNVTALRTYDDTQTVSQDNLDFIQHQAPTSKGSSGSSVVACGEVVGVNNAGTVSLVVEVQPDGSVGVSAEAAASNNFAVHVRHIHNLISLFRDNAIQGEVLPVPATVGPGPGPGPGPDPDPDPNQAVALVGQVGDPFPHIFVIEVRSDGTIAGLSDWSGSQFNLSGVWNDAGAVRFSDDAATLSGGQLPTGWYEGNIVSNTSIEGVYFEEGSDVTAPFVANVN